MEYKGFGWAEWHYTDIAEAQLWDCQTAIKAVIRSASF